MSKTNNLKTEDILIQDFHEQKPYQLYFNPRILNEFLDSCSDFGTPFQCDKKLKKFIWITI